MNNIKELIEVTTPYFALKNVCVNDDIVEAEMQQELFDKQQVDGMTLAEAGRHMAILGSLAAASLNPIKEKHYYLASHAVLERVHEKPCHDKRYTAHMRATSFNKKNATASGSLYDEEGKLFYTAVVNYSVLTINLFDRFFSNFKVDGFNANGVSPYGDVVEFQDVLLEEKRSVAILGKVDKKWCVGHFDNYPALPVAQISQGLMNLAARHNASKSNDVQPFCVKKVIMHATSFIFADEYIQFMSEYNEENECYDTVAATERKPNAVSLKCFLF